MIADASRRRKTDWNADRRPLGTSWTTQTESAIVAIAPGELWVCSLSSNDWRPLELRMHSQAGLSGKVSFRTPYGQMVYVARNGVLLNISGRQRM